MGNDEAVGRRAAIPSNIRSRLDSGPVYPDAGSLAADVRADTDFASYYRGDLGPLVGFMVKFGASPHDAVDIAQSAMAELYRHWQSVRNPKPWVRTAATRMYLQSDPATGREVPTDPMPELISQEAAPERVVELAQQAKEIQTLLAPLPLQQRMALVWLLEGLSQNEIARELNTTPAAVPSAVARARTTLRKALAVQKPKEAR